MADVSIVDTHVHLWNPSRFRMSWLDGSDLLNQPYELAEYANITSTNPVEAFVFVETGVEPQYAFLEAQWVASLARQEPRLKGIVTAAPLEHGERAHAYLQALVATSPLIKGVRRLLQGEADPLYCLQPDFVRGVQLLPELGLSFDICIYHYQLPGVIELVKRCPETTFILDHIAKPDLRNLTLEPWRENMRELAALPNVACKISGVVTEADHHNWQENQIMPYLEHVVEVFGEDRIMFGSDWPVMLLATHYPHWVQVVSNLISRFSPSAQRKFWAENARKYYRLGE